MTDQAGSCEFCGRRPAVVHGCCEPCDAIPEKELPMVAMKRMLDRIDRTRALAPPAPPPPPREPC